MPFQFKSCELPSIFAKRYIDIPVVSLVFGKVFTSEWAIHLLIICLFAGLIAPFGGFFASGLKRGLKIKVCSAGLL